jgi:hypothetical protein
MPTDLADGGPLYAETDLTRAIAEPWNAASASVFVLVALFWLVRLWGHYRSFPFVTACMPLLALGGVGGTLYHASRASYVFFLLDVVPISLLILSASLYLWARLLPPRGALALLVPTVAVGLLLPRAEPSHLIINLTYLLLVGLILLPTLLTLAARRGDGAVWVVLALASFGVALFFRIADLGWPLAALPMGTHWLWHLFGALATLGVIEFVYRVERTPL